MSAQTVYNAAPAIGFAGMLAQSTNVKQADSTLAEGIVLPGYACKDGSILDASLPIAAATDVVTGISVYSDGMEQTSAGVVQYDDKVQFPLLKKGRIFVAAGEAVAKGDSVYAGLSAEAGKFYNDSGIVSQVYNFHISEDFVTSNSIAITLDGQPILGTPVLFDTDNATTLAAVAAALENDPRVLSAVSDGVDDIAVTSAVGGTAGAITVAAVVTGGAAQATVTWVEVTAAVDATRATVTGGKFLTAAATDGDICTVELW
jgi:hypothetical protein